MEWKKDTGDAEKEMLGSLVLTREGDRDRGSEYGAGGCFKMLSCKTTRKIRSEGIQRSTSSAGWQDSWVWVAWCLIMHASFDVCTGAAISHIPDLKGNIMASVPIHCSSNGHLLGSPLSVTWH